MPEITHAKLQRMQDEIAEFHRMKSRGTWDHYYEMKLENKTLHHMLAVAEGIIAILGGILIYIFVF